MKINKFDLVVSVYIFCVVASELMGGKTFGLLKIGGFNLNASTAIFLLPMTFAINDIITEIKGRERARGLIKSSIVVIALISTFSLLAVSLPPSERFVPSEQAYDTVFGLSLRISLASLVAFALSEMLDVAIYCKIRKTMGNRALWLRTNLSNFVSQFVDTAVFMMLAFYSLNRGVNENMTFIVSLAIPYWILKCLMSIINTPFVYLGVGWLRKDNDDN